MSEVTKAIGLFDYKNTEKRKRVGRGRGSGLGKTCVKGQKGQKARSGVSITWFEGGQTPLYVRLPRRGFNNIFRTEYKPVNFLQIQSYITAGKLTNKVTIANLIKAGAVGKNDLVKILAKGECPKGLTVEAHAFSQSAIDEVTKSGGSHILVSKFKESQSK